MSVLGILSRKLIDIGIWDQKLFSNFTETVMLFKIFGIHTLPCAHNAYVIYGWTHDISFIVLLTGLGSLFIMLLSFLCVWKCTRVNIACDSKKKGKNCMFSLPSKTGDARRQGGVSRGPTAATWPGDEWKSSRWLLWRC